jgi:hypothetical protein
MMSLGHMDLPYRILGSFAWASEVMSRSRVNGLGLNWWIMLGIGMFAGFAGYQTYESIHNRAGARDVTVAQAVADKELLDTFVRVTGGNLFVDGILSQGEDEKTNGPIWVPIVDQDKKYAMYVQLEEGVGAGDISKDAIRGMLRRLTNDLKDHVAAEGIRADGVRLDTGVMLVAGERPARLWLWGTLTVLSGLVILLMLLPVVMRYVVFRRHGAAPALAAEVPPVDPAAIGLHVSGKFRLDDKTRQRFLDTPAIVAEMESGDRGLLANVNASRTMYGHVTENRAGTWAILIRAGTLDPPDYGSMYCGSKPRPAMRLRFTDAATNKRAVAVLSFARTPAATPFALRSMHRRHPLRPPLRRTRTRQPPRSMGVSPMFAAKPQDRSAIAVSSCARCA